MRRLSVPHDGGNLPKRYTGTPLRAILALRGLYGPRGLSDKPQSVQGVGTVLPSHLTTEPSHSARSSPFTQTHQVAAYDGPSYPQLAGHRWSTCAAIRLTSQGRLTMRSLLMPTSLRSPATHALMREHTCAARSYHVHGECASPCLATLGTYHRLTSSIEHASPLRALPDERRPCPTCSYRFLLPTQATAIGAPH